MVKKNVVKKEIKPLKLAKIVGESEAKRVRKVLIIEGHVDSAISISTILDFHGFRTFQAYNREDGLKIAKIENPNLVILNPVINGVEHTDLIEILSDTKMIILKMSGDGKIASPKKNILGFLDKPVDKDELLEMIDDRI